MASFNATFIKQKPSTPLLKRLLSISVLSAIGFVSLIPGHASAFSLSDFINNASSNTTTTNDANSTQQNNFFPTNPCPSGVDCLISGYGAQQYAWLFKPPYDQTQSMASGGVITTILSPSTISPGVQANTQNDILTILTNSGGSVTNNFLQTVPGLLAPTIVLPPNTVAPGGVASITLAATPEQKANALSTLDFNSLLGPSGYQKYNTSDGQTVDQRQNALYFIQYVSNMSNPLAVIDFNAISPPPGVTKSDFLVRAQQIPEVAQYLMALRNYSAQMAVGLSNLYEMANERTPITDATVMDKVKAAMTPPEGSSLAPPPASAQSPLQIEQYMATRRINDPNWYTHMQNASPATIDRSILYLLAELPPMLLQLHLDLERLTATMSVMELGQVNGGRMFFDRTRNDAKQALQTASNPPPATNPVTEQINQETRQQGADAVKNMNS